MQAGGAGRCLRNELLAADKESRICRVPYNVAIWLAQSIGFDFRFIDFIQGSQQSLQYYLRELQSRHVDGTDNLPWDGAFAIRWSPQVGESG